MEPGQPTVIVWLNAVLMALTFTALCARVGRRVFVVGQFSWHDTMITIAAVSAFAFSIFQIYCVSLGLGLREAQVSKENLTQLMKLILASNVFYFLCNWVVKHALLLFYSEIVRDNKYQWSIWVMHFVAFGFGLSSVLVNIFQCRPFSKAWHPEMEGYCVNIYIFLYVNASIMLTTDLVLYTMPVIFTWHLQLRRPQRIGLNALFALGGLVLAASAARVNSVHRFAVTPDFSYWFGNAMIWAVLENHLAIVVACAPSVKVIALLVFPKLASSLGKVASKLSGGTSSSRSRSRGSAPLGYSEDLESGTRKSTKSYQKGDKLKITPAGTPLPSPAFTAGSGGSRASKGFSKWFRNPISPISPRHDRHAHLTSGDSMEDRGLVYSEDRRPSKNDVHLVDIPKEMCVTTEPKDMSVNESKEREGVRVLSPTPVNGSDIRVEHTITVDNTSRVSTESDVNQHVARAV